MKLKPKGWISLYRKLLENPIANKPNYLAIWIYILLNANRFEKEIIFNNKKMTIKKGSFITSIEKIADFFGLAKSTVSYVLDYLKVERMIERTSYTRYTVITVKNYNQYQDFERLVGNQQNTNKTPIRTTNKEDKVDKVDNNRLVVKITNWAYNSARVSPSCKKEEFIRSVKRAIDRVGENRVFKVFESEVNAIQFLKNIKTL